MAVPKISEEETKQYLATWRPTILENTDAESLMIEFGTNWANVILNALFASSAVELVEDNEPVILAPIRKTTKKGRVTLL